MQKNNGAILKKSIIEKLEESFKLMVESVTFDNQQLSISNIYVTSDLASLVTLLGKELSSPK